jgi:hypothetical protein
VPISELWRINVFSAHGRGRHRPRLPGARRLGRPIVSAAARRLAAGATFWSQAVIAEVYTLHAALVAGLLAAFAWSRSRRPGTSTRLGCPPPGSASTTILAFARPRAQAAIVDRRFASAPGDVRGDPGRRPPMR